MVWDPCQPSTLAKKCYSFTCQPALIHPQHHHRTASTPRSYLTDAKGKQCHRSREHIHPLQQDLFKVTNPQLQKTPKPTCIPKPKPIAKPRALPNLPKHIPLKSKSYIPIPIPLQPSQPDSTPPPSTSAAMVDNLFHHLVSINDHPPNTLVPMKQHSIWSTLSPHCLRPITHASVSPLQHHQPQHLSQRC